MDNVTTFDHVVKFVILDLVQNHAQNPDLLRGQDPDPLEVNVLLIIATAKLLPLAEY